MDDAAAHPGDIFAGIALEPASMLNDGEDRRCR
jgi:hypothetical protein